MQEHDYRHFYVLITRRTFRRFLPVLKFYTTPLKMRASVSLRSPLLLGDRDDFDERQTACLSPSQTALPTIWRRDRTKTPRCLFAVLIIDTPAERRWRPNRVRSTRFGGSGGRAHWLGAVRMPPTTLPLTQQYPLIELDRLLLTTMLRAFRCSQQLLALCFQNSGSK